MSRYDTMDDDDVRVMGACEHGTFNIAYRRAHWGMDALELSAFTGICLGQAKKTFLGLGLDFYRHI